ncbi:ribosomal protein S18-alanine N-acetyltransferase [Paenibacillus soyae]|uniref:Ribosomal protein S18-alanine N-acetyltransferase n=1 Tax=Paenibacillus soyae TaxID=2969249 RepID=A0A9X2MK94_9BACL|nr:ribosomal protein S18-alanine N-acetyltransferase [Paenibacillus soyae]MCR2803443.1 ribosomal protein S18-alanine N-acetyltransferase [Paenibacillus soyae]
MSMDTNKLIYRAMTKQDIPAILAIEEEAFSSPWSEEAFQNELTNNMFARYLVMEYRGELLGYGGMWVIVDEAHITNIAVRADMRGKGLGNRLLDQLQRTAVFFGAARMTLEVRVTNKTAQKLYRKFGFEPAGIRPRYYSDNNEDALIMWAELDVEKLKKGGRRHE